MGPTLIAAGDDEGAVDAGNGIRDCLKKKRLPFAADRRHVDLSGGCESIDQRALSYRSDKNHLPGRAAPGWGNAGDAIHVCLQIVSGALDAWPIGTVNENGRGRAVLNQGERAWAWASLEMARGTQAP